MQSFALGSWDYVKGKKRREKSGGNERTKPSNCEVIACVCAVGILQNMGLKKKKKSKLYQASIV